MSFKDKLRKKELVIGSWIQLGYPQTTEIIARAGFEFVVVDMEHTSISASELLQTIQIADLAGLTVLVRVGTNDPLLIKRAMDAGADGIIVPMVETREEAERARDAIYYPPKGLRGVGLARAQGFGLELRRLSRPDGGGHDPDRADRAPARGRRDRVDPRRGGRRRLLRRALRHVRLVR